jgi:hypothetical protein
MPEERRFALIIACNEYEDSDLQKLVAPAQDAKSLTRVLEDAEIGGFEVNMLLNQPSEIVTKEIESFFNDRKRDDLLVLYFSCHGMKDKEGRLYYATKNTRRKLLRSTAIPSSFVNEVMKHSDSKRQMLLLDCCYAGAFAKGLIAKSDKEMHTGEHFEGYGKIVLTASDAMQYSFEGDRLKVENENVNSVFTRVLVHGLDTGEADMDRDGNISYDELYRYTFDRVVKVNPAQTPGKWDFGVEGEMVIAKNKNKEVVVQKLPEPESIDSEYLLKLIQDSKIEEFNKLRNKYDIPLYFRRSDLSGKNLIGIDLHEADLRETKLINAKLSIANLKGTRLIGADLSGADLRSVDLYGSNLTKANLSKVDLRSADLRGMIDFTGANLTGADLRGADLKGMVNFENAVLCDTDFTGAFIDVKMINFNGADTSNAKGLPSLHESNEYLEALKSFSEAINQQFKSRNISPEQLKPIEESIKELVKEVKI